MRVCDKEGSLRATQRGVLTFADSGGGIQEEVPAAFKHTLSQQGDVGRLTSLALTGTPTAIAVGVTA